MPCLLLSCVWLFVTPWTVAHQAPLSMGILQARILEWAAISFSRGSSQPRDQTQVSHIIGRFFTVWATGEAHMWLYSGTKYRTTVWYKFLLLIVPQRALAKFGAYLKTIFSILKLFFENNKLIAPGVLGFLQTSEFWPVIFLNLFWYCTT